MFCILIETFTEETVHGDFIGFNMYLLGTDKTNLKISSFYI